MQKNALVSSGSCSARDEDRICLLNGLYAADWSKVRPLIFAIAGDGGVVRVYDLGGAQAMVPVAELENPAATKSTRTRIHSIQFNHRQRDFLACGDANGNVHVWQLSWEQTYRKHCNACIGMLPSGVIARTISIALNTARADSSVISPLRGSKVKWCRTPPL